MDTIKTLKTKQVVAIPVGAPVINMFDVRDKKIVGKKTPKPVLGSVSFSDLGAKIKKFVSVKKQIKGLEERKAILETAIKDAGKEKFLELYHQQNGRPDTFNMEDNTGAITMFVVGDDYKSVTKEKEIELAKIPGVTETITSFTFDEGMVQKYGLVLSRLILESKEITDEDKLKMISKESVTRVQKGTIDRLMTFENPDKVFKLIEPKVSLK